MKLLVGLGNPGNKYEGTRHNVGFATIDKIAGMLKSQWIMEKKFESLIINYQSSIILSMPQTFMNSSGDSVTKIVNYYHINTPDIWIIHDDLDIKLGQYKIQKNKGPKVHYGVSSIEEKLGTRDFFRVRIGIENRTSEERKKISGERYVLQKFSESEAMTISSSIDSVLQDFSHDLLHAG